MKIKLRGRIPFLSKKTNFFEGVPFAAWIPDESLKLTVTQGDVMAEFWVDKDCAHIPPSHDGAIHSTVIAHSLKFLFEIDNVSERAFLEMHGRNRDERDEAKKEHIIIAETLYDLGTQTINHISEWLRAEHNDFWLEKYPQNHKTMDLDLRQWSIELEVDGNWVHWYPVGTVNEIKLQSSDFPRDVQPEDWENAIKFASEKKHANLVLELLANADLLINTGSPRSALLEGCSALEVAIGRFTDRFDKSDSIRRRFRGLFEFEPTKLSKKVDELGVRIALRLLFPLLFTEDEERNALFLQAANAMEKRNNVIHNGARNIAEEDVVVYLKAIRKTCLLLDEAGS